MGLDRRPDAAHPDTDARPTHAAIPRGGLHRSRGLGRFTKRLQRDLRDRRDILVAVVQFGQFLRRSG